MHGTIGLKAQHCDSPGQRPGLEVYESCWAESSAQRNRLYIIVVVLSFQPNIALDYQYPGRCPGLAQCWAFSPIVPCMRFLKTLLFDYNIKTGRPIVPILILPGAKPPNTRKLRKSAVSRLPSAVRRRRAVVETTQHLVFTRVRLMRNEPYACKNEPAACEHAKGANCDEADG